MNIHARQKKQQQEADISRDTVPLSRLLESCLTPSPTWTSCQAVALHIRAELTEGEMAIAKEEPSNANERPIPQKRALRRERKCRKPPGTIIQPCSDIIKRHSVKEVKRR